MPSPEHMKIPYSLFPAEIISKYNLNTIANKGYVYIRIIRCMYGLKEAAIFTYR